MKELKIITSNIRFANPADGIHDWTARKDLLAGIYQAFDPDLLGTQEGRQGQTRELDKLLPKLTLIDGHRKWIDERMYPCLYVNPERITVHRSGDIWLSETPEVPGSFSFQSAFPRLCTWIEMTMKESGLKLMVVNTHLDHILQDTREKQIQVLINEIKKINSLPLFIMGDFNESPDTSVQKNLVNAFHLKDPWSEKNYPEETSHHSFKGHEAVSGDRIDWILIPESYECREIRLEKKSFNGIYPSDHYPLLATVIPK